MITLYNKDCMEALKEYPSDYFDCAIVDPPYGIKASSDARITGEYTKNLGGKKKKVKANNYTYKNWDNKPPEREYFLELQRVSKNQIIWGANHFIDRIPQANSSCWIVWNKRNGNNNNADCELAYTSFKTAVRMFNFKWNGMLQQNMKNKEIRIHPTQKPAELYRWILERYCKKGDKILDTHLGSGSIAIAVHDLGGFELVGYELDTEYYTAACKRLKEHQRQLKLFEQV